MRPYIRDYSLRFLLLFPTILFGLSCLNIWIILGCLALIFLSPNSSKKYPAFSKAAFFFSILLLCLTLMDRIIQAPNHFPSWDHLNWKSYVVAHDFFSPEFITTTGEKFQFVYYYGIHAVVAVFHNILPSKLQGELALEIILAFVGLIYSAFGLGLLIGLDKRFKGVKSALLVLVFLLFLPGIEVLLSLFHILIGKSTYVMWPDWWLGVDATFGSASQPESGWLLSWVPQQTATLYLQAFFWLRNDNLATKFHYRCLVIAAALPTSPFFAIGWIIVFLTEFSTWWSLFKSRWVVWLQSALPLIVMGLSIGWFFTGKAYPEHIQMALSKYSIPHISKILLMIFFVFVENFWLFFAITYLLYYSQKHHTIGNNNANVVTFRNTFHILGIVLALLILAQFRLGIFNDLYMRASAPLVLLQTFYLYQLLISCKAIKLRNLLFTIALIFGFCWHLCTHFVEDKEQTYSWKNMDPQMWYVPENRVYRQYMGIPDK